MFGKIVKPKTAGWREVDGERIYFRSRWEFNFSLYLRRCAKLKQISYWRYEPTVFWFHKIKRGVRSYKPDFLIVVNSSYQYYVEIKGYLDSKSKTRLKRMRIYYPDVEIRLVDGPEYRMIEQTYSQFCSEWEF